MDTPFDLLAWLRFTLAPRLTAGQRHDLLKAFETPDQAFSASRTEIIRVIGEDGMQALAFDPDERVIDAALQWIAEPNHHFVVRGSPAEIASLPAFSGPAEETLYLDERVGRQLLHVTFGSVLTAGLDKKGRRFKERILELLDQHADLHQELLAIHFGKHLSLLNQG